MTGKKLYRSSKDQVLGGVAAGIAEYLDIDTTLIRLVWAASMLAGFGIAAYILAWIIIPIDPSSDTKKTGAEEIKEHAERVAAEFREADFSSGNYEVRKNKFDFGFWFGLFIIFFAISALFQNFFGFSFWQNFWPIILIAFGLIIIASSMERK
jgi:phage shock protein PspC (stress-responsive transcriptional regulator)